MSGRGAKVASLKAPKTEKTLSSQDFIATWQKYVFFVCSLRSPPPYFLRYDSDHNGSIAGQKLEELLVDLMKKQHLATDAKAVKEYKEALMDIFDTGTAVLV